MEEEYKKTLLFDFDGTLADSLLVAVPIINQVAREMGFKEISVKDMSLLENKSAREIVKFLGIPSYKLPLVVRRARILFKQEVQSIYPVRGICEALEKLYHSGVTLGILTSNTSNTVEHFIRKNKIDYFVSISASSGVWSKSRKLKKMISKMGVSDSQVIYVGDEMRDIVAAKKIGIQAAAVTWGYNSKAALEKEGPDFILEHPSDLLKLI